MEWPRTLKSLPAVQRPIQITAIVVIVLDGIYQLLLRDRVLETLGPTASFVVLDKIAWYVFVLAMIAVVLGGIAAVAARSFAGRGPSVQVRDSSTQGNYSPNLVEGDFRVGTLDANQPASRGRNVSATGLHTAGDFSPNVVGGDFRVYITQQIAAQAATKQRKTWRDLSHLLIPAYGGVSKGFSIFISELFMGLDHTFRDQSYTQGAPQNNLYYSHAL